MFGFILRCFKNFYMKQLLCFLCVLFSVSLSAQEIQRATLGMSGSSSSIKQGNTTLYVSETIGQQSAIGTFSNGTLTIRQGFQQPPVLIIKVPQGANPLNAVVFPNPVVTSVTVGFNEEVTGTILTKLFDIQGKLVISQQFDNTQNFQIDMSHLSTGTYLLKITNNQKEFTTRLLKN